MAKKKANSTGTLSSHWCPPTDVVVGGVGEPVACIASTFEFDASFFESQLLPRFLGLRFDDTENELSFLTEREEKLALVEAAILVDVFKVDPGQTTLRWDQVPISVPGSQSIQHSKIVLLAWERLVRLIVSSANLTRPGYRRNREVFASLDFYDDPESLPSRPVTDAIRLLETILEWSRVPDRTRERTRKTLSDVRDRLRGWKTLPEDFRPLEKPKVRLVATHPAIKARGPMSAIEQVATAWGSRSVSEITVFTPFVGEPDGEDDKVIQRLAVIPRSRDCVGFLVAPRRPTEESDSVVRVALPAAFGNAWHRFFNSRGGGQILAVPQFVKDVDKVNRLFHNKVLSLECEGRHFLMIGSSNFTPHGMGVGVFNVEANLLFEDLGKEAWSRIELPIGWDEWDGIEEVQWDERSEPAEDSIDHTAMLPRFFACASYSQVTGELKVILDHTHWEPSAWAVRLQGDVTVELSAFDSSSSPGAEVLIHTFPEDSRSASLAALLVEWVDGEGQLRQARLIVSIESKNDLVASSQFRGFGVDAMIDCLVHGRSLAEWQERQLNMKSMRAGLDKSLDSLQSVDTSGYLLYLVRRFGHALSGLCERLERVVLLAAAVQYRLLKDPLGPIALADAIANADGTDNSSFAALSNEHRLFLLAELLLAVARTCSRMLKQTNKKTRKWLEVVVQEAISAIAMQVSSRQEVLGPNLPTNLRKYVSATLTEANDLIGHLPAEAANAC